MSRTYRLRHLPRVNDEYLVCPKKFGDGKYSKPRNKQVDFIWEYCDLPFALRRVIVREIERENPPAIGAVWSHPWVGYGSARINKTWYRTTGNRRVRHKIPPLLKRWAHLEDDFEEYLPVKKDGWDPWCLW